jgi:superoxide dismutase
MSFWLPELPYAHDALAPYMSRETLEYHHDKHHLAYVNNGNNLAKGTEWEDKPVEEVLKGTFGKNQGLFKVRSRRQPEDRRRFGCQVRSPRRSGQRSGVIVECAVRLEVESGFFRRQIGKCASQPSRVDKYRIMP